MDNKALEQLKEKANIIRKDIIEMLAEAKSGHPGGSLSAVEILTYLYFKEMNVDPSNPQWQDRDRFILSKGHGAPVLYSTLAEKGYFPKGELMKLRKTGAMLQGHPDMKGTPGVDMSTGSLGQGLSASNGMALAAKLDNKNYRVYALLGDGEMQEGQVWEAAMTSAHYKLDNLTVFIDNNGLQIDGTNEEVKNINPIEDKWKVFGWHVITIDGHDLQQIEKAVEDAKNTKGKPTAIIAKTVKGKGVSFMENQVGWHGVAPNAEQKEQALKELEVLK
ncbi:transketolase [Lutispora sp.]|uniref:transketolase n=1 Tax=Lutispora sp. TaxID=2828727 RepID=UPI003568373E